MAQDGYSLEIYPLHLGLGAQALPQPPFTNMEWYESYAVRTAPDGGEGRLVSMYRFFKNWDSWEMHPCGDEVVLCLSGQMILHQEHSNGSTATVTLSPYEYAVNPPGTWHTADVEEETVALFITAGAGTKHKPR
ncbi:MAG: cupin [Sphingorhabdus sp.]|uniref:cupin n=1 Tax=Sphingorhabdus sp. TaxID=1902408 RepID=UPI0038FC1D9C